MAVIRVGRPGAYFGAARKLKVWIDGRHVGDLQSDSEVSFEVPDGSHQIQVSMDWCKSKALDVIATSDRETIAAAITASFVEAILCSVLRPSKVFEVVEDTRILLR